MAKIDVLDAAGKKTTTRDLPAEIFEAKVSVPLMHQVVVAGLAGIRAGTHSTKTRGDVRGGGRKPWRLISPLIPWPFDTATTSTNSPGWKTSTVISWPAS
jgi:hypothetical protein